MANSIDTSNLTELIAQFRQLQAKDTVTPESLGTLLQQIVNLLASAAKETELTRILNWWNNFKAAPELMFTLSQGRAHNSNIYLNPGLVEPDSGETSQGQEIAILPATTSRAGAMTAQQVKDLGYALQFYYDSPSSEDLTAISQWHENFTSAPELMFNLQQGEPDASKIILTPSMVEPDSGETAQGPEITILPATTSRAGAMTAQQVQDLNTLKEQSGGGGTSSAELAELAEYVSVLRNTSSSVGGLQGKAQIAVEVVDGKLKVWGSAKLLEMGYVPFLFRFTRKRNRNRNNDNGRHVRKGWNVYGSHHAIKIENNTVFFSTNEKRFIHEPALGYSTAPETLFRIKENGPFGPQIAWGKGRVTLDDPINHNNHRMLRMPFAIGFAKPPQSQCQRINVLNLVSNLAQFSVIYDDKIRDISPFHFSK